MRAMKDSGVEWIGQIPSAFRIHKLKYIIKSRLQYGANESGVDFSEDLPRYIRITDITPDGNLNDDGKLSLPLEIASEYLLSDGDILFARSGATVGKTFIYKKSYGMCAFAGYLIRAVVGKEALAKYVYYFTLSSAYESWKNGVFIQATIQNIGADKYSNLQIPVPSIQQQSLIVGFLDAKCAQIDAIIEKQQQVIEKLKAYKQSVITEAVTKGLDPTVPMKDSGVDYLGSIPESWTILRLRYVGTCQNGISKGGEFFGSGYPFVSYSDVYKNAELPSSVGGLVESTESEQENYSVQFGDVFFTRTSETIEEVGLTSVCMKTIEKSAFAGFLIRVRPKKGIINPVFSKYYFRSDKHRLFFVKEMNLVTRASLGQELLKRLPVLLPPIAEQEAIAAYLDDKCAAIDRMIDGRSRVIAKLTDYKKSLIYEAVTGKMEV